MNAQDPRNKAEIVDSAEPSGDDSSADDTASEAGDRALAVPGQHMWPVATVAGLRKGTQLSVLVDGHVIATDTVEAIRDNVEVQKAYLGDSHA